MSGYNIVIAVVKEIARVEALLEKLDTKQRDQAERSIRFARLAQQQCSINDLYESLDDLREFRLQ